MRRTGLLITLVLMTASLGAGCSSDRCKDEPPSFQLDIRVQDPALAPRAKSLLVELTFGDERKRRVFALGESFADGATSIAVELVPAPQADVSVTIEVRAFADTGGMGELIAAGSTMVGASPDGCNRFETVLTASGPSVDGGVDGGATDVGFADAADTGVPIDTGVPGDDSGVLDAANPDADSDAGVTDLGVVDSGPDAGMVACAETADSNTVALYTFSMNLDDVTGNHPATLSGSSPPTFGLGAPGCGEGLQFGSSASVQGWATLPDSTDWDLNAGSVDLWLQIATTPGRLFGVISRDATGSTTPGHFTLYIACDGTVVAKIEDGGNEIYHCSNAPLTPATWSHVGVNFGAPGFELYVDGQLATRTTDVGLRSQNCTTTVPCGGATNAGLAGNDNPWVLGVNGDESGEGMTNNLAAPMRDGQIDSLRISNARRSF